MTLMELLTVIAIIGILAGLGIVSFRGWINRYNIETEVKQMYADLMQARLLAMDKNRTHFATLSTGSYAIYDDTSPAPNGDGTLTVGSDTQVYPSATLTYPITWGGGSTIEFTNRGLVNTSKTICVYSTFDPSYDCLLLSATRIRMGKLNAQGGSCTSDKCDAK